MSNWTKNAPHARACPLYAVYSLTRYTYCLDSTGWCPNHLKKGSCADPANYRSISLTSIMCKPCEHIIHCAAIQHLSSHNILSDAQHGFWKHRSCGSQLLLTINDLAKGLDDKSQLDVILLDYEKAFNKVSHRHLLLKAEHYGIRGSTLNWIKDFLIISNITQL